MTVTCPKCSNSFPDETKFCPNDGYDLHSNRTDQMTGKLFDKRYQIHQKIGQGGMGAVYKATQVATGKTVAIKVISKALSDNPDTISRFKREVRLQSMLEHPNIINVIDFVETTTNDYYFVMNYVEGQSLKQLILGNGKLPLNFFYQLALQILNAIDYAHSNNIIHRDLKSDNIIISRLNNEYVVKILDFGIAKVIHESDTLSTELTRTGMVLGTPSYMAPEQAKGELSKVGPRSDIYSLGVIFYQMLSGDLPFHSDTPWGLLHMHIYEHPVPLRKRNMKTPKALEHIIMKCLEKEPEHRFASVAELKKQIMKIAPPLEEMNQMIPLKNFRDEQTVCGRAVSPFNLKKLASALVLVLAGIALFHYRSPVYSLFRTVKSEKKEIPHADEKIVSGNSSVKIFSDPGGASVEMNGMIRKSPALFEHLKADRYFVSIRLKGYDAKQIEVELAENQSLEKKVNLKKQQGEFHLESVPSGGEVWMNGELMGVTPITIGPIDIGAREIVLKKEGYEDKKLTLEVLPDESLKFGSIELIPSLGKMFVRPENRIDNPFIRIPEKVKIKIGDENWKEISLPLEADLRPGKYKIEIEADGFEKKIFQEVGILPHKTSTVKYELAPKEASLRVKSDIPLEIFEDDRRIGKTGERIDRLIPGKHDLVFKAEGFKPIKNSVILNPGEFLEIAASETHKLIGSVYVKYALAGKEISALSIPEVSVKIGEKVYEKIKMPFLIRDLPVGKYPVALSMHGFKVKGIDTVEVVEGRIAEMIFELEPLKSGMRISSPETFEIWENGIKLGNSNTEIKGVAPGSHEFVFKSKGAKDRQRKISLSPGESVQIKEEPLQKLKGSLRVSCEVRDFPELKLEKKLRIKIGDRDWKNIPMSWIENDVPAGECRIEMEAIGFKKVLPLSLVIEPEKMNTATVLLEPRDCEVIFKSNVLDTRVFEGKVCLGKTGEVILLRPFKEHGLILKAGGFRDKELKIVLEEPGLKNEKFEVVMEKIPEMKREKAPEVRPAAEIRKEEAEKEFFKIKILSPQNKEFVNGKNVRVEWRPEGKIKVYQYKILLNNKTFKTISETHTIFKGLEEGKYLVTIIAVEEGGDESARGNYSFTVLKKAKFYHSF